MDLIDLAFENIFVAIIIPMVFVNSFFILNENYAMKADLYKKIQTNEIHYVEVLPTN